MLGLCPIMRTQIFKLHIWEMEQSRRCRFFMSFVHMAQQCPDVGTTVIVIAAAFFWKGSDGKMSVEQVFPTLAVISPSQGPTLRPLEAYTYVTSMTACFSRNSKIFASSRTKGLMREARLLSKASAV